ncbi:MAG: exosortase system-associated protein, TIGR04073 family [Candidatus Omnitrophica bacterium]|nr:exosortase system-associated protein, TIGR04073 family [Candidatus Omnitrophota bacterium]MBI3083664.1 exosortase system-associated protein, TIGR04073 family [Candidatus Omnitrophota bacterium]
MLLRTRCRIASGLIVRGGLLVALASLLGGCWLFPFDQQVRRLQQHVGALERRVDQIEEVRLSRGVSGLTVQDAPLDLNAAGTTVPVAPVETSQAAPVPRRLPGLPFESRKAFAKFLRGMVNVLTGWVELPKRVHETTLRSGAGAGFTYGFVRGLGYGFIRTSGGVYEVITFPFPAPPDYKPVMQPAYIFLCDSAESYVPPEIR